MIRCICVCVLSVLWSVSGVAQSTTHSAHQWFSFVGDHPLGKSPWQLHLEGQWRMSETGWQQLLLRPGVNYLAHKNVLLTAGYGYIKTNPKGTRTFPEHRIWEQALLRYKTDKLSWVTRLRYENRFLGVRDEASGVLTNYRYENRFRAMQRGVVPISEKYFLAAYDELFFYIPPYRSASAFDQNRAYVAIGHRINPDWDVELGYQNQFVRLRSGLANESNHILNLTLVSRKRF